MESLEEYGLRAAESSVYLKLLEHEELTANQIAQQTGINRSVAYSHIDALIGKGLVSYAIKNNVKYFRAAKPETLLHYLKEKQEKLQQLLPSLQAIKKQDQEDISVELYRGVEGATTILKDMIRTGKDINIIGYVGQLEEIMPVYLKQYLRQLDEKKMKEHILAAKGAKIITGKYGKVRYLPKEFEMPTSTVVYGNKVVIVVYAKPYFSVLITSKDVADSYRRFFNLLWAVSSNEQAAKRK